MTHDARMRRGTERQEFVGKLKSIVAQKEINCPELAYELAAILFQHLATASDMKTSPFAKQGTRTRRMAEALFTREIVPAIEKFSNANEERYKIMVELHEWLSGLIIGQFISAFGMWESATFKK